MFQQRPLQHTLAGLAQHQMHETVDDGRLQVGAGSVLEVVA